MKVIAEQGRAPIKLWVTDDAGNQIVPVEEAAMQQLRNVASLPFVHKHVAAMPDVHWGMGATIGSVIATNGAIVPAAVGVDLLAVAPTWLTVLCQFGSDRSNAAARPSATASPDSVGTSHRPPSASA